MAVPHLVGHDRPAGGPAAIGGGDDDADASHPALVVNYIKEVDCHYL
jgi:hypothetical protein